MTELRPGQALGPEWRVTTSTTEELLLTREAPGWRKVGGALVVSLGTSSLGLALAFATEPDARMITWPVSGLLFLVALVGLLATARNFQRARIGVRLRFTRDAVEGWPVSFALGPRRRPAADIARITVQLFPHPPLSLALLEVVLRDGSRLSGPELAFPRGEAHPLEQVAQAAAQLTGAEFATR